MSASSVSFVSSVGSTGSIHFKKSKRYPGGEQVDGAAFSAAASRLHQKGSSSKQAVDERQPLEMKLQQADGHPSVRVYALPYEGASIVGEVPNGTVVLRVGSSGRFLQVRCPQLEGWVGRKNAKPANAFSLESIASSRSSSSSSSASSTSQSSAPSPAAVPAPAGRSKWDTISTDADSTSPWAKPEPLAGAHFSTDPTREPQEGLEPGEIPNHFTTAPAEIFSASLPQGLRRQSTASRLPARHGSCSPEREVDDTSTEVPPTTAARRHVASEYPSLDRTYARDQIREKVEPKSQAAPPQMQGPKKVSAAAAAAMASKANVRRSSPGRSPLEVAREEYYSGAGPEMPEAAPPLREERSTSPLARLGEAARERGARLGRAVRGTLETAATSASTAASTAANKASETLRSLSPSPRFSPRSLLQRTMKVGQPSAAAADTSPRPRQRRVSEPGPSSGIGESAPRKPRTSDPGAPAGPSPYSAAPPRMPGGDMPTEPPPKERKPSKEQRETPKQSPRSATSKEQRETSKQSPRSPKSKAERMQEPRAKQKPFKDMLPKPAPPRVVPADAGAIDRLDEVDTPRNGFDAAKALGLAYQPNGLKVVVSAAELRAVYRRAALKWHPDRPCWVRSGEKEEVARASAAFHRASVAHDLLQGMTEE
eukprot:TRINITY_DN19719_c0_g1_i1.p1 TRINITY_DN19719_c0_g1~~TRINITY_DN19719_c0_g1_i1.p1  ORF type:complete len:663 (-),score=125.15 TRINITY_DN19719_c0_g1_i1:10-1971(-)